MLMTSPGCPIRRSTRSVRLAKTPEAGAEALTKDQSLRPAIATYIAGSTRLLEAIDLKIRQALEQNPGPILVTGAGQLAMQAARRDFARPGRRIAAFVDGSPIQQGTSIRRRPRPGPRADSEAGISDFDHEHTARTGDRRPDRPNGAEPSRRVSWARVRRREFVMIRVADYIARTLFEHGIEHVFMVTGGGAMPSTTPSAGLDGLKYVCCHHEQACTMAADSYYRLTNRLAAVNVTTGPGGTNADHRSLRRWTDSLGMVVVSGQVKWETLVRSTGLPLRATGRSGGGHHPPGRADHQVCGDGHRARTRSGITSSGRSTWPGPVAPGPSGSTSRSTCKVRSSTRTPCRVMHPRRMRSPSPSDLDGGLPREVLERLKQAERAGDHGRLGRAAWRGPAPRFSNWLRPWASRDHLVERTRRDLE